MGKMKFEEAASEPRKRNAHASFDQTRQSGPLSGLESFESWISPIRSISKSDSSEALSKLSVGNYICITVNEQKWKLEYARSLNLEIGENIINAN